jgi:Zn-finger in ubiquitin-hydrolases and other protein
MFEAQEEAMVTCTHLDQVLVARPDHVEGCEDCLAIGASWLHLRVCRSCGRVGCCDSSPNRHASRHARATGHPIITSAEHGEDWSYCFVDDVAFVIAGAG